MVATSMLEFLYMESCHSIIHTTYSNLNNIFVAPTAEAEPREVPAAKASPEVKP